MHRRLEQRIISSKRGGLLLLMALAAHGCATTGKSQAQDGAPPAARCDMDERARTDLRAAWQVLNDRYVYHRDKAVDWSRASREAVRAGDSVASVRQLIGALEGLVDNVYDPHVSLRSNTASSHRLVPSGLDVWAEWKQAGGGPPSAVITAVRPRSRAERAGVRPGMTIKAINGVPVGEAADARLGRAVYRPAPLEARQWALLSALAGRHDTPRVWRIHDGTSVSDVVVDSSLRGDAQPTGDSPVEFHREADIGYIRVNALWDLRTVAAFDSALETLRATRALVLDLRNTPEGGTTAVAEPIIGRFIRRPAVYQVVVDSGGKRVARHVDPRGPWTYTAPVAVLVGRWTGSMGEGMAVAFDGIRPNGRVRGLVVGTSMAGLAGAVEEVTLPCSGLVLAFPASRLLHVNGTPREHWRPPHQVDLVAAWQFGRGVNVDVVLARAMMLLSDPRPTRRNRVPGR